MRGVTKDKIKINIFILIIEKRRFETCTADLELFMIMRAERTYRCSVNTGLDRESSNMYYELNANCCEQSGGHCYAPREVSNHLWFWVFLQELSG